MNVHVNINLSAVGPESFDALARIVQAVGDGWHEWVQPDPADAALDNYFAVYQPHRELVEKSYTRATLYPLESRRTIVIVSDDDIAQPPPRKLAEKTQISLAAAAIVLTQPLGLLVENEINDGAFLRRLLEIVDRPLIDLFLEPRARIRFDNGGGKTVALSLVESRAEDAAARGIPLRLLLLTDSDARYPGHVDKDTKKLQEACAEYGASLFVLQKRAIENYVTDAVFEQCAETNPDVAPTSGFILSLPPFARDHYPIKKGLPAVDGKVDIAEGPEKRMYDDVEFPSYRPKLPGIASRFVCSTIRHTSADLEQRSCLSEVETIARWIREEL